MFDAKCFSFTFPLKQHQTFFRNLKNPSLVRNRVHRIVRTLPTPAAPNYGNQTQCKWCYTFPTQSEGNPILIMIGSRDSLCQFGLAKTITFENESIAP